MTSLTPMSGEERLALIKENLAEFLNPEIIEDIIKEGGSPKVYWGGLQNGQGSELCDLGCFDHVLIL